MFNSQQELISPAQFRICLAIFTIIDGDAQLLDACWLRYKSILLDTGEVYTYSNGGASIYEYALQVIDEDGKNLTYKKKFGRVTEVVDLSYSSKMGTSGFYEMNYAEAVLLTLLREEDKEEFIVAQNANIERLRDRTFEIIEYICGTAGEYVFIYESPAE